MASTTSPGRPPNATAAAAAAAARTPGSAAAAQGVVVQYVTLMTHRDINKFIHFVFGYLKNNGVGRKLPLQVYANVRYSDDSSQS